MTKVSQAVLDANPVGDVQRIPIENVQANDYNPNSVATQELKLLYTSILEDWYTQPVVTIFDEEIWKYVIIDWFHRYFVCKTYPDIRERNEWLLPCVVLKKDINQRMASTVRHNRARGHHSIQGMSNIVFNMLDNGIEDDEICRKLWLEPEELLRLKHVTWFAKLFEDVEYSKARMTRKQLQKKKEYLSDNPSENAVI